LKGGDLLKLHFLDKSLESQTSPLSDEVYPWSHAIHYAAYEPSKLKEAVMKKGGLQEDIKILFKNQTWEGF